MTEAADKRLASSVVLRSFYIYFEPIINLFQSRYIAIEEFAGDSVVVELKDKNRDENFVLSKASDSKFSDDELAAPQFFELPKTSIERDMAIIWKDILQVDDVGRNSNFFEIGGHSLLLIELYREVEDKFRVRLPLGAFFLAPRLSELALLISYEKKFCGRRLGKTESDDYSVQMKDVEFPDV